MNKFRQEFEMQCDCRKTNTMFNRFSRKYNTAWEVWGEMFEYMLNEGIEHIEEQGWSLWLYTDEQRCSHYMAIVLTDECQKL